MHSSHLKFVTEDYFDGGLANYINRTSRLLADRGHDVHVVTLSRRDEKEFEHDGVMVHRVMLFLIPRNNPAALTEN